MHSIFIYDYTVKDFDTGLPTGETHRVICSCGLASHKVDSLSVAFDIAFDHLDEAKVTP